MNTSLFLMLLQLMEPPLPAAPATSARSAIIVNCEAAAWLRLGPCWIESSHHPDQTWC